LREALRTHSFWILFATLLLLALFLALLDHRYLPDRCGSAARGCNQASSNAIALGIISKLGWLILNACRRGRRCCSTRPADRELALPLALPHGSDLASSSASASPPPRDVVTRAGHQPLLRRDVADADLRHLMLTLLPGGTLGPIFAGAVHDATGSYGCVHRLRVAQRAGQLGLTRCGTARPVA
jgi:hypothetical protein